MFFTKSTNIRYIALVLIIALFGGALWYIQKAQGVTRTWDGGGADANWNTAANWSGDTVPTSSDVASFDGTCVSNCSPTVNVSLSGATAPAGINMASDYAGTITQSSTFTITVGASNWVQAGGTFTGGSGAITINGTLTISGGTFTSTTGTLTISGTASSAATLFTHTAGGTFNHNNGTVYFYSDYHSFGFGGTYTVDVATSETFNNFTVQINRNGGNLVVTAGDTLIVLGTLTHTEGKINTGTLEVRGNVVLGNSNTYGGGTATISFLIEGDQTITGGSDGFTAALNINKPSGTVSASGSFSITGLTLSSGTFTSTTGTLTINGTASSTLTLLTHTAGGTFNHNNGTVYFYSAYSSLGSGGTYTVDVATSETFNNLTVYVYGNGGNLVVTAGDTLIVLGTLTHTGGKINTGTLEARGNVVESANEFGGGTATLSFTGANDQTYTKSGTTEPDGDITINKTGGIVSLLSNANWNASGQDLTITSGTLKVGNTYALSTTALTVGASGVLKMVGTGDLTLAGNVANDGQIIIESNQTCGGTDDIQILSSVAGTQRAWSGAGTVTIYDATVKDQGGSAAITAYSSTSVSGNGANWTFSGAACPSIAPALNITSGLLNIGTGIVNFR